MNTIQQIQNDPDLLALADAGDWDALAAAMPDVLLPPHKCSSKETANGLIKARHNWMQITEAFDATAVGRDLKAIMRSADGIDWSDPLTVQTLAAIKADVITQAVIDTLLSLSRRIAEQPTADDLQRAWMIESCLAPIRDAQAAAAARLNDAKAELDSSRIDALTIVELTTLCKKLAGE